MALVRQILIPRGGSQGLRLDTLMTKNSRLRNRVVRNQFRHYNEPRSGMLLSTTSWMANGRYIQLFVNPRQISWSVPRRETVVKTAAGAVRNTWRNRYRNTYLDEFTLNITFQTGNIMPSAGAIDETYAQSIQGATDFGLDFQNVQVPPGLENFYEFWELVDSPALLGAFENRHVIIMYTRAFPVLRLEGYFTGEPVTWEESADHANQLVWQANFQVYWTVPRLTSFSQMASTYQMWVNSQGRNEALRRSTKLLQGQRVASNPNVSPTPLYAPSSSSAKSRLANPFANTATSAAAAKIESAASSLVNLF